jgi:hypothetical protein
LADLELNGVPIVSGRVHLPRVGLWTADLELDDEEAPTGRVTLASGDGELSLAGFVRRGGSFAASAHVHVVGGAGGLDQEAPAVYYRSVTVRTPLHALLSAVGETLAASSDATALGAYLERWSREKGPAGTALAHLAEAAGADWRALDDGTIWLGTDTYPEVDLSEDDYELMEDRPSEYLVTISTEQFPAQLRPGTTFLDRRVEFVEYNLSPRSLTTRAWFQRNASSSHPILGPLQRIIRHEMRETRYHALYQAVVRSQGSDDSVDIIFDDNAMPAMSGVPLYKFAPGITVKVTAGARCLIAFAGGNPSKPLALAWQSGLTTEVPVKDCGTLVFTPNAGTAAAVLQYVQPGVVAPPVSPPMVNIPLSGRIKS